MRKLRNILLSLGFQGNLGEQKKDVQKNFFLFDGRKVRREKGQFQFLYLTNLLLGKKGEKIEEEKKTHARLAAAA